ncbi:MAG: hypothetical protein ACRDT2_07340, partial [Natronosporangium sp.]
FDLAAASYEGRCLSRPVFLDQAEQAQLAHDLDRLHAALASLPDRLFGGDIEQFARAVGLTGSQVGAVGRAGTATPTRLGRADLYHDGTGFRLMELNLGSNIGGLDTALLNGAFLAHPKLARFVEEAKLTYVDTLAEVVDTLRTECRLPADRRPLVAAVDWPDSFASLEPQLRHSAAALYPLGIEAVPCHIGQVEVTRGRVWLDRRPVDAVYRIFMLEDLADPAAAALAEPLLGAVERGEVAMFTPMHAELFGSKAALAMLSDEAHRHLHDPQTLASLDRILPWTRRVRPGEVTVDGHRVDLFDHAREHQAELVLKPASLHGGSGVVLGWQVDAGRWRGVLRSALDGAFVLQRRVRAVPELFPATDGRQPWLLRWGVFTVSRGYGGATVIGTTATDGGVVNMSTGAIAGCCFHQSA